MLGEIVLFTLDAGDNGGKQRPAIVCRDWGNGTVNLQVFTDSSNDGLACPYWKTSIVEGNSPGTYQRLSPPGMNAQAITDSASSYTTQPELATAGAT